MKENLNVALLAAPTDLENWVIEQIGSDAFTLIPQPGDASFKCFYRLNYENQSYVVMTFPANEAKKFAFDQIAELLAKQGLTVPVPIAKEIDKGYFLLRDFGDLLYLQVLDHETAGPLYAQALSALHKLQGCPTPILETLPLFDARAMQIEFELFTEWCLPKLLTLPVAENDKKMLNDVFSLLIQNALEQPQVLIHRDYHSRNLFVMKDAVETPGIIDFQDALIGPITYDLASILKDCYISWPIKKVEQWVQNFHLQAVNEGRLDSKGISLSQFMQWFDWMGLQRHLKVLGIFSRLNLRDHKPNYLRDTPRIMRYVIDVSERYSELNAFSKWIKQEVLPRFQLYWEKHSIPSTMTTKDFT